MALASLVTGGASLLGGLFGKSGQEKANKQQMAFAADQAQRQMDFQERMSNTAHQREIKDLEAAGLNPILSAHGGASSPGGAAGSANIGNTMSEVANSARDLGTKVLQSQVNKAQVANLEAENQRIREQTKQLQISNVQQGVMTPAYIEAGKAVDSTVSGVKKMLGIGDAGDIVQGVLDAGKNLPSAIADGKVSIPNSAKGLYKDQSPGTFDLSRLVGTENSRARKWATGQQGFLESLFGASQDAIDARNANSAKQLTEDKVKAYGQKLLDQRSLKRGFYKW